MEPEFPVVQIEIQEWDEDIMGELFLFDEFYYSDDDEFYNKYFYRKQFLDSTGRIFLAGEKVKIDNFMSKLGISMKYKVQYKATSEHWTFEEAKSFLISKIEELPSPEGKKEWINSLNKAKTIKQLIEAER
ncbi:hypothetical protein [Rufibacter roseus]|uniref:Uncharacterized protein n=1 Tax=Rufibacter roseus TaxID=1567108 RepID=A0ABW2DNH3_9BACT|nr:hypothetical protein [Rufibacter roseus]